MATRTVTDELVGVTANQPDRTGDGLSDPELFSGEFSIDRLDDRAGILLEASYAVFLQVQTAGVLLYDGAFGNPASGVVQTFFAVELDPDNELGLELEVGASTVEEVISLFLAVPGFGLSSTPVTYSRSATSGEIAIKDPGRFVGEGSVLVEYEGLSGVTAFAPAAFIGPQGGLFTNSGLVTLAVEYTYRPAIDGNAENNRLDGTKRADVLLGLGGRDTLRGDTGADRLYGDAGADNLAGGAGNDRLLGGPGSDVFVFTRGGGRDVVADFGDGDRLDLSRFDVDQRSDVSLARVGEDTALRVNGKLVAVLEDIQPGEISGTDDLIL